VSHYVVRTLGCKANLYDSQLIENELQKRGWSPFYGASNLDLCIVNSCTVTDEADRQSRKMASRLAREYPGAAVVITGCAAEVEPERLAASKGIHYVIGNRDKPALVDIILNKLSTATTLPEQGEVLGVGEKYSELLSRHPIDREWPEVSESFFSPADIIENKGLTATTRAFLKIQEGCNSFCTYCIIPYGRGPSRSLRPREILEMLKRLVASGVREVVLTGTNIGDYGTDWAHESDDLQGAPMLGTLLKMMLDETSIERIRVSSLDPTEITPDIFSLMESNPRLCPHFHVSLQASNDKVLRLMKRKYQTPHVKACLEKIATIKAPLGGVFVGMDVITGFPGEGDEEFESAAELLKNLPWSRMHVFPYSERAGTPATRLPGKVEPRIRKLRAEKLAALSLERLKSQYEKVLSASLETGEVLQGILLEKVKNAPPSIAHLASEWVAGYTPNYLRVFIPMSEKTPRNGIVSARPLQVLVDEQGSDVAFLGELHT